MNNSQDIMAVIVICYWISDYFAITYHVSGIILYFYRNTYVQNDFTLLPPI